MLNLVCVCAELESVASAVEQLEESGALRQCDLMCILYDGHSEESMAYAEQFFGEVLHHCMWWLGRQCVLAGDEACAAAATLILKDQV